MLYSAGTAASNLWAKLKIILIPPEPSTGSFLALVHLSHGMKESNVTGMHFHCTPAYPLLEEPLAKAFDDDF